MTYLSAKNVGIERRGLLRPGYFADLVIFDERLIKDEATIAEPQEISSGIVKVFVNGAEVFSDGVVTGRRPGRVITRKLEPIFSLASGK